ncbi:hypothetical protein ScPMuIL_009446 [Solemya velum]
MAAPYSSTIFGSAVKNILDSWTVLQLAVNNGFGGVDSREKAEWMVYAVETWFKENSNIEPYEVEDFLAEVVDNEFDTQIDDGSLPEISGLICGCYRLSQEGRITELREKLKQLKPSQLQRCAKATSDDDAEEDELTTHPVCQSATPPVCQSSTPPVCHPPTTCQQPVSNGTTSTSQSESMDTDDGWQVVSRGKKK